MGGGRWLGGPGAAMQQSSSTVTLPTHPPCVNGLAAAATASPSRLFTHGAFGKPKKLRLPLSLYPHSKMKDRYFYCSYGSQTEFLLYQKRI